MTHIIGGQRRKMEKMAEELDYGILNAKYEEALARIDELETVVKSSMYVNQALMDLVEELGRLKEPDNA